MDYYAEFPFLDGAKQRIDDLGVNLPEIADTEGHPARVAAVNRVRSAISDGEIDSNQFDSSRLTNYDLTREDVKLVSYPLARIIVSIINDPIVTKRYVDGEAKAAIDVLQNKLTEFRSKHNHKDIYEGTHLNGTPLMTFLEKFGVGDGIYEVGYRDDVGEEMRNYAYEVEVLKYLQLADGSDVKPLRELGVENGYVIIAESTLFDVLHEAIRNKVDDRLPLSIPDGLLAAMGDEAAEIQAMVQSIERVRAKDFTDVEVPAIPKYIKAIINKSRENGGNTALDGMERYTAILFLTNVGASPDEVVEILQPRTEYEEDVLRKQAKNLGGENGSALIPAPSYDVIDQFDGEPGELYKVPDVDEEYETPLQEYSDEVSESN